jgi:2-phospho-L-lactate guanylyltransferase
MIRWHALVPVKQDGNGKSRLSDVLSIEKRDALSLRMALHVLSELAQCPAIADVTILSARCPVWWSGNWNQDFGRGLNPEISAWRRARGYAAIMIIHADLPLLQADEVEACLSIAASQGIAIATDRAGSGTNMLAIADGRPFAFRFGPDSRLLHAAQAKNMSVIQCPGLSTDIDTPEDLVFAREQGFSS